jgi:hypothetical protein
LLLAAPSVDEVGSYGDGQLSVQADEQQKSGFNPLSKLFNIRDIYGTQHIFQ